MNRKRPSNHAQSGRNDAPLLQERASQFDVPCRIAVERTDENMFAHMLTAQRLDFKPGDTVDLHGEDIDVRYGQSFIVRRSATVTRAGPLRRFWMRLQSLFEITGLYEVSFSPRRFVPGDHLIANPEMPALKSQNPGREKP